MIVSFKSGLGQCKFLLLLLMSFLICEMNQTNKQSNKEELFLRMDASVINVFFL